eukprot:3155196-Pleurochrysis_carterae.AAC.1
MDERREGAGGRGRKEITAGEGKDRATGEGGAEKAIGEGRWLVKAARGQKRRGEWCEEQNVERGMWERWRCENSKTIKKSAGRNPGSRATLRA